MFFLGFQLLTGLNAWVASVRNRFLLGAWVGVVRAVILITGWWAGKSLSRSALRFPIALAPPALADTVYFAMVASPLLSLAIMWVAYRRKQGGWIIQEERLSRPIGAWALVAVSDVLLTIVHMILWRMMNKI